MPYKKIEIRRGAYYDSVVLMELQAALKALPGVLDAGVMMGTTANKALLAENDLSSAEVLAAQADDLIISLKCNDQPSAEAALKEVDNLLARRRVTADQDYSPKTLEAAVKMLPQARWVLISVPGSYAAGLVREALRLGKNIFLYSDNVPLADEVSLKKEAAEKGLLVMGPDCGTAIINGVGFGFANRVRNGPVGLIGASGTGVQQVASRIHQSGSGITHALGTGGRDLKQAVGGITARQCLGLLQNDPHTEVIVLISKPPDAEVAALLLNEARNVHKPVVVNFIGYTFSADLPEDENLFFTNSLDEAAEKAVALAKSNSAAPLGAGAEASNLSGGGQFLRGLFSGGTLAYEMLLALQSYLPGLYSNISADERFLLSNPMVSREHTIIDLGEDEFTVGRPHPMLDNSYRIERFKQEASDPQVAIILLDVVLGYGAHRNPAAELAPAIKQAREKAEKGGCELDVVVLIIGTDEDPQNLEEQVKHLQSAGARVEKNIRSAVSFISRRLQNIRGKTKLPPVDHTILEPPVQAINMGLQSFAESLSQQDATFVHVDWRPPAGGNEKLMSILERMKNK